MVTPLCGGGGSLEGAAVHVGPLGLKLRRHPDVCMLATQEAQGTLAPLLVKVALCPPHRPSHAQDLYY